MKYEIEFNYMGPECSTEAIICCLTGLDPNDIKNIKIKDRLTGSDFKNIFRDLGFDTNDRFVKFDHKSKFPMILRCVGKQKGVWFAFVYHNGVIWNAYSNEFFDYYNHAHVYKGKVKIIKPYNLKITSMLQVWI